ncbi:DNA/RNA polymerases superfamily protein [Cucumis melo var. makuwa]|uniref:DNA/RNA polymerases superfamily protein n=1 Tax=Cucumis melo var. makuwa TaxID=1194695 RepID=A0A5D3C4Y5_CUCMM|nr:DNA/RNA polymerases superfamily protein [Cucumis melo var. makuwa]TYK06292.1 DNA/RNA polymerases superfamily protein [Cucumis melo var. makuwa]
MLVNRSDLVQVSIEKIKLIRDNLKIAQDRQKSYADKKQRDLEFKVRDQVFLRSSPWKGVLRFVELRENLSYEEDPVQILDRKKQVLRNKTILLVKVLWRHHGVEEAT